MQNKIVKVRAYLDSADETTRDDVTTGLPGLGDYDPDVFPLDRLYVGHPAENWAHQTSSAWPFSTVTFTEDPLSCIVERK